MIEMLISTILPVRKTEEMVKFRSLDVFGGRKSTKTSAYQTKQ